MAEKTQDHQTPIQPDKRYKSTDQDKRKTYEVHLRLSRNDYLELRANAGINGMKISEYVRNKALIDKYRKINTDYDLYSTLNKAVNVLTRTGNYMVKVISFCQKNEDYQNAVNLKEMIDLEKKSILELKKLMIEYQVKIYKLNNS